MALISTKLHGAIDYATGAAMLAAPSVLRMGDRRAAAVLWAAGAGTIATTALSDHDLALSRKLPMPAHLALDAATGLALAAVPKAVRLRGWVPHAVFGVSEIAVAALTDRGSGHTSPATAPADAPAVASPASEASDAGRADAPETSARDLQPADDGLVAQEARAAAADAARIGGIASPVVDDPVMDPVYQAGGGEQDGWETAEEHLIENAAHGDGGGDPLRDAFAPEAESDAVGAVFGEADHIPSTELVDDPSTGEDDPGAGPGLAAERG